MASATRLISVRSSLAQRRIHGTFAAKEAFPLDSRPFLSSPTPLPPSRAEAPGGAASPEALRTRGRGRFDIYFPEVYGLQTEPLSSGTSTLQRLSSKNLANIRKSAQGFLAPHSLLPGCLSPGRRNSNAATHPTGSTGKLLITEALNSGRSGFSSPFSRRPGIESLEPGSCSTNVASRASAAASFSWSPGLFRTTGSQGPAALGGAQHQGSQGRRREEPLGKGMHTVAVHTSTSAGSGDLATSGGVKPSELMPADIISPQAAQDGVTSPLSDRSLSTPTHVSSPLSDRSASTPTPEAVVAWQTTPQPAKDWISRSSPGLSGRQSTLPERVSSLRTSEGKSLPCPSWEDLLHRIKLQQEGVVAPSSNPLEGMVPPSPKTLDGVVPPSPSLLDGLVSPKLGEANPTKGPADEVLISSPDEVLRALALLGLPFEFLVKRFLPKSGLLKQRKLEGLLETLELFQEYGLTTSQVRSVVRSTPSAFSKDAETLRMTLEWWLSLGVERSRLGAVVSVSSCLALDLQDNLRPKAEFIGSLGLGPVGNLIERWPALLDSKLERLAKNVEVLRSELNGGDFRTIVERNPALLQIPTDVLVGYFWLSKEKFNLSSHELAMALKRVRARSSSSCFEKMRDAAEKLESSMGRDFLQEVVISQPTVLLRGPSAIEEITQNLLKIMTPEAVRTLLVKSPILLLFDWSRNIEPAMRYVVERCGLSAQEALQAFVYMRALEDTLKPRVEFLLSQGMVLVASRQDKASRGAQNGGKCVALSSVVKPTRARFVERFPAYQGR